MSVLAINKHQSSTPVYLSGERDSLVDIKSNCSLLGLYTMGAEQQVWPVGKHRWRLVAALTAICLPAWARLLPLSRQGLNGRINRVHMLLDALPLHGQEEGVEGHFNR